LTALTALTALRAFTVAARAGEFAAAGAEPGVTSAAVSQQVKALEAHPGKQLFRRRGNRIAPTDAGRAILPRLGAALAVIAAVTAQVRDGQGRAQLVVPVLPPVAGLWLIPVPAGFDIAGFDIAGVDIAGVEVRVEDDSLRCGRHGAGQRRDCGAEADRDQQVTPLSGDRFARLAAPDRVPAGMALHALTDGDFIHTDWGPACGVAPTWAGWFAQAGSGRLPDPGPGVMKGFSTLAVVAAVVGLGVALVRPATVSGGCGRRAVGAAGD